MKCEEPLQNLTKALLNKKLYPIIKQQEEEILSFLKRTDSTMHTQPLSKQERWVIHQLADLYKLGHSVQGSDEKREMTLSKQPDTILYKYQQHRRINAWI